MRYLLTLWHVILITVLLLQGFALIWHIRVERFNLLMNLNKKKIYTYNSPQIGGFGRFRLEMMQSGEFWHHM